MPLREDLLAPISGANPSGQNLRYAPVYDKIKEARRKEDPVAQGDWQRALKEADYRQVIKLSSDALAKTSKDLQIAAWLTEALVYQEGLSGLASGLDLLKGLLETFWDSVYPEPEDGDMELRAAPLSWVGEYRDLELAVRSVPLTKGGFSWLKYTESRKVGYEADVGDSDSKRQARSDAIGDGKLIAEDFDADVAATSLQILDTLIAKAETALEKLAQLDDIVQEKFGNDAPSFRILRVAIEDVQHTARILAAPKREAEPQPEPEPEPEETQSAAEYSPAPSAAPAAAATATARARVKTATAEPVDREDAIHRIIDAAAYLRRENPKNPVSYLALRGLRWGELRTSPDGGPNPELLEAPPTEIRQQLKRLMMNEQWDEVLQVAESAMGLPCGRGWLDLQRYVVRACTNLGYEYTPVANAICSELRTLLHDFPQLPSMTLLDDTATANSETQAWLAEFIQPAAAPPAEAPEPAEPVQEIVPIEESMVESASADPDTPDPYDVALDAARSGDFEQAMKLLSQQIAQERSGRGRFLRRMQFAQICIFSNRYSIALPILQDLAREVEARNLEGWEQPETVAQTLVLLLQAMQKLRNDDAEKDKIFAQICRLDPLQAARLTD